MNELNSIHFVTGKLAEHALREIVHELSTRHGFNYTIDVMPITVAALMTPKWLLRHLQIPDNCSRVILPGYLRSGLEEIRNGVEQAGSNRAAIIECGPKDLRDLPNLFGAESKLCDDFGEHSIEIIAEINHVNRLTPDEVVAKSEMLISQGADRIDLGCDPSETWEDVEKVVSRLTRLGIKTSIDSFNPQEVAKAASAGSTLVLSVDESNCHLAKDWGIEVVAIPSDLKNYRPSLQRIISKLEADGVRYRIDPILEPIGCGFAASLDRYFQVRNEYPDSEIMMGIGNITELTDVDSAGVNLVLLGYCEELRIRSVLTTQVISWAQSAVRECHIARQLTHYAVKHRIPPKRLSEKLVMLRDSRHKEFSPDVISKLAQQIKDNNYRIFCADKQLHIVSAGVHLTGDDPFELMSRILNTEAGKTIDPAHAFYLGFELQKALTANTLGKNYEQDEALRWGFLTRDEEHHRLTRSKKK